MVSRCITVIEGKGQPVVLVHGFSEDGTVWENQVAAFKNKISAHHSRPSRKWKISFLGSAQDDISLVNGIFCRMHSPVFLIRKILKPLV